ncbi:MAG: UbiD family decarboxylase [Planctomycetaceae bacterium]
MGSERYVPYAEERRPQELLTCANAISGQGQLSLAKYLLIVAKEDDPGLDIHQIDKFLLHLLSRVDWTRDLHFQTRTTMDTLDYSGTGLNEGSKLVMAAAGEPRRNLPTEMPTGLTLPRAFLTREWCCLVSWLSKLQHMSQEIRIWLHSASITTSPRLLINFHSSCWLMMLHSLRKRSIIFCG